MTKIKPMTEPEWLSSTNPWRMLRHVQQHLRVSRTPGGARLLRLLAVAGCRQVWSQLTDPRSRTAVEVAERYADGKGRKAELEQARTSVQEALREAERQLHAFEPQTLKAQNMAVHRVWILADMPVWTAQTRNLVPAVRQVLTDIGQLAAIAHHADPKAATAAQQQALTAASDLVRDIFGNPFHPTPAIRQSWLTWHGGTVEMLARAIYEERAFDRLPLLADALEEAGCTDAAILEHCRQKALHARSCWLADALLRKR
jgi:hypothetical protein